MKDSAKRLDSNSYAQNKQGFHRLKKRGNSRAQAANLAVFEQVWHRVPVNSAVSIVEVHCRESFRNISKEARGHATSGGAVVVSRTESFASGFATALKQLKGKQLPAVAVGASEKWKTGKIRLVLCRYEKKLTRKTGPGKRAVGG